jgi:hypothetical protein
MNQTHSQEAATKPFATQRQDTWWLEPALVAIGFTFFVIYATYRAFQFADFEVFSPSHSEVYLSPFYSPKLAFDWWKWSPAILILWVPAGFRATCYYYRKAYYRAYFMDPPACAVGHFGGDKYCGETTFPFVFQNIHRYMLYCAIAVLGFLWYDTFQAFFLDGQFRVGVGSLIFLVNVVWLSAYTGGCHALRHLVGGKLDCFSCSSSAKAQFSIWHVVTKFNEHHMFWAWLSLFSVMGTDFYVSQLAAHHITDITLFGPTL